MKKIIGSSNFSPTILFAFVFASGAAIMALEILGSRILAPYFGSTLFVWGSLIGVVLISLSVGYFLGGKLADKKPDFNILAWMLFVSGIFIFFVPTLASIILGFDFITNNAKYGPLIVTFVLFFIPTVLLAMVSPFAIKLKVKSVDKLGNIAGNLYFVATVGSIVGTFLTVFFLIPNFGVRSIILSLSAVLVLISFFWLKRKSEAVGILIIVLFLVPTTLVPANYIFNSVLNGVNYETIYETDSLYFHIIVADDSNTLHNSHQRVLFLNNLPQSSMYLNDTSESSFPYTYYFHMGFLFNPEIKDVLFIGGGGFSAPKKFLEDYEDVNIDVVEIDPEVVEVAKEYFYVEENERLNIVIGDGRQFLLKTEKKYDLIVLDAYSSSYVPFHLMTLEFFNLINDHLKENGVVMSNLITSLNGELSNLYRSEYKTIAQIFPNIHVVPTRKNNPPIYIQNVVVIGTKSKDEFSTERLLEIASGNNKVKIDLSEFINNLLDKEIKTNDVPILTDDYAPVNNLLNPVIGVPYVIEE